MIEALDDFERKVIRQELRELSIDESASGASDPALGPASDTEPVRESKHQRSAKSRRRDELNSELLRSYQNERNLKSNRKEDLLPKTGLMSRRVGLYTLTGVMLSFVLGYVYYVRQDLWDLSSAFIRNSVETVETPSAEANGPANALAQPNRSELVSTLDLFSNPAGASIQVDGRSYGHTPTRIEGLEIGVETTIVFRAAGYMPDSFTVLVERQNDRVDRRLKPESGEVFVRARPASVLWVDGELIEGGLASNQFTLRLPTGLHRLRVESEGRVWEESVVVDPLNQNEIKVDFDRRIPVRVEIVNATGQLVPGTLVLDRNWRRDVVLPGIIEVTQGLHIFDARAAGHQSRGEVIHNINDEIQAAVRVVMQPE